MCHLNLIYKKDRKVSILPSLFMNVASWQSWQTNKDGEGFFGFRNKAVKVHRSMRKIRYAAKYWLLASHQRLGTSGGRTVEMCHPFNTENLMIMHNGIFSGKGNSQESDTKQFADALEQAYKDSGQRLVRALRHVHRTFRGFYSVIIYEKGTRRVYYYKNRVATINVIQNNKWLVLSTSQQNTEYAKQLLNIREGYEQVQDDTLYEITSGFRKVARIIQEPEHKGRYQQDIYGYPKYFVGSKWQGDYSGYA